MSTIPDISLPGDLKPSTRTFAGHSDTFINTDGIIELCRRIDTPQAKAVYHAFRKRLAEYRTSYADLPPEKQRAKAIMAAIADVGWNVHMAPAPGGAK